MYETNGRKEVGQAVLISVLCVIANDLAVCGLQAAKDAIRRLRDKRRAAKKASTPTKEAGKEA